MLVCVFIKSEQFFKKIIFSLSLVQLSTDTNYNRDVDGHHVHFNDSCRMFKNTKCNLCLDEYGMNCADRVVINTNTDYYCSSWPQLFQAAFKHIMPLVFLSHSGDSDNEECEQVAEFKIYILLSGYVYPSDSNLFTFKQSNSNGGFRLAPAFHPPHTNELNRIVIGRDELTNEMKWIRPVLFEKIQWQPYALLVRNLHYPIYLDITFGKYIKPFWRKFNQVFFFY